MTETMKLLKFDGDQSQIVGRIPATDAQLRHFVNVTNGVTQDALKVWADLWGELQNSVVCGVAVVPGAEEGFRPSCGWPEFIEKMWVLRHSLDFLARFSRQRR